MQWSHLILRIEEAHVIPVEALVVAPPLMVEPINDFYPLLNAAKAPIRLGLRSLGPRPMIFGVVHNRNVKLGASRPACVA